VDRDLFQIFGSDDIYFTLGMWAMLSPRLLRRESTKALTVIKKETAEQSEPVPAVPVELTGTCRVL
jgi:hypothetical protein